MKPLSAALLTVCALLAVPAGGSAAAPANDDFADREVLTGSLPLEVTRSNVEATKEDGEFIPGLSPAGRSVWFEWEATDDGWVTIGACDNQFPTVLAVFTGTEVGNLTNAAGGNGSEGPDCPYQGRQYTFRAVSGTKYVIAVDGNNFHLPESPTPVTEGEILLRIEETPTPPNDDFEDATAISGSIEEEPDRRFYFANARGFTWTATIETGEPEEASSGASVWYSFTAPEDATYNFSRPCCQAAFTLNRDLYLGDAVDELTPLLVGEEVAKVPLSAGETVRIRVSGPLDSPSDEPPVANFDFNVTALLAPLPPQAPSGGGGSPPPPPPEVAPETRITQRTLGHRTGFARFRFGSTATGASFRCKLDKGAFKPCASPKTYRHLKPGRHTFRVRAVSPSGLTDGTAAVGRFLIAAPQNRR